jgi:hypothetical protein
MKLSIGVLWWWWYCDGGHDQWYPTRESSRVATGEEPLFEDELTRQVLTQWQSKRIGAYTKKEDKLLCKAWMIIVQDRICGTQQKEGHIGGGCKSTSSIDATCPTILRVIRMIKLFKRGGHLSCGVQQVFWCVRSCSQTAREWYRHQTHGTN